MKIAIVGGGVAGLYAAYKALKLFSNAHVTIIEKERYLGGRIKTVVHDGVMMDSGAARFNDNHKLLLGLMSDMGLTKEHDMWPLTTAKVYVKDTKTLKLDTTKHIKDIIRIGENTDVKHLKSVSLKVFIKEHLPDSLVDDIIYSFGYNTEFDMMNAYDALQVFKTDFLDDEIQYYVLKQGMSELVKRLTTYLEKTGRCSFMTGCEVKDIRKGAVITRSQDLAADIIVLAITKKTAEALPGLSSNKALQASLKSLGNGELLRIFSKYPKDEQKGRVWFHDMPRVTTNNFLRYIIPLNYKKGSIMVSYTDGHFAREWNAHPDVKSLVAKNLKKLFPTKQIPEALWTRAFYWDEGTHCWLPGARKYKNTRQSLETYGYLVCGEMISERNQAWIEGALDTVEKAFRAL